MPKVTAKDGTAIGYDRQGSGPALILVGGATQYRAIDPRTAELARLLSRRFDVINYDRRGRGESGDTLPYAVEREIEDIAALIEAAGGSAALYGSSSGAALCLDAAQAGLGVTKLALYEPPFSVDGNGPAFPADYVETVSRLGAERKGSEAVEYFMTKAIGMPEEQVAGMKRSEFWAALAAVGHTLEYDARCLGDAISGKPLSTTRWARVTMPVLVIDGGASFPFMPVAADALAKVLPDARRHTLGGQDHGPAPDVLAPVLEAFLAA